MKFGIVFTPFCSRLIEPSQFTSPDTVLEMFCSIFRNVDWDLVCNIENLQDGNMLEYKPRTFYNYVLCREDILGNMRQLGNESLLTKLDTLDNLRIFIRSLYYGGKGTGRRDLMHIKDTINTIVGWQDRVVKSGGKIYTCMRALLE